MAQPINYNIDRFIQGINGFGAQFCTINYSATLGASSDETVTVPSSSAIGAVNNTITPRFLAIFSYQPAVNVWVALNATAAVPAGATFASVTSELLPSAKVVKAGDVIHFITAHATTDVGVAFYALPEA